jgi:hypothetical protein
VRVLTCASNCVSPLPFSSTLQINCPVPKCPAVPFPVTVLRERLPGTVHDRYVSALIDAFQRFQHGSDRSLASASSVAAASSAGAQSTLAADANAITAALSLQCPNAACGLALDPAPDGCCAMKCANCASYFCWLCIRVQPDSNQCHSHVRACNQNPCSGSLFPDRRLVEIVQRQRRIEAVRRALSQMHAPEGRDDGWQRNPRCLAALDCAAPVLRDSMISIANVLESAELYPVEHLPPAALAAAAQRNAPGGEPWWVNWLVVLLCVQTCFGAYTFYCVWMQPLLSVVSSAFQFLQYLESWLPFGILRWLFPLAQFVLVIIVLASNVMFLGFFLLFMSIYGFLAFAAPFWMTLPLPFWDWLLVRAVPLAILAEWLRRKRVWHQSVGVFLFVQIGALMLFGAFMQK